MLKIKLLIAALSIAGGFGAGMITSKKLEKPVVIPKYECPACNCPASNNIDFDKIKGKGFKIEVNQHYQVEVNGDSLVLERFKIAVEEKLKELKVSRCR